MSEWNYIVAAYAVTWAVIIGYGAYLLLRAHTARDASQRFGDDAR